jgi:CrcB protein
VTIWLAVGVGGACGAMARHGVNQLVHRAALGSAVPSATMLVNVVGSLAIGVLAGLLASGRIRLPADARAFLTVGVLGGFTTFSTFSLDALTLARGGQFGHAALYVIGQVVLGLAAVWAGFKAASF